MTPGEYNIIGGSITSISLSSTWDPWDSSNSIRDSVPNNLRSFARYSAVLPELSFASISMPCDISNFGTAMEPLYAASWRAVCPDLSFTLTSNPREIRYSAIFSLSLLSARWRSVLPSLSIWWMSEPREIRSFGTS